MEGVSSDFAAAKDIRIYSMASWLRECYHGLSKEYKRYGRQKANRIFFANSARFLVILLRDGGAYALLISMVLSEEISVGRFVYYELWHAQAQYYTGKDGGEAAFGRG